MLSQNPKWILILNCLMAMTLCLIADSLVWATDLEVKYPRIPGITPPESVQVPLSFYLNYIFELAVGLAGFLVFFLLIRAGTIYVFNSYNPGKVKEAKEILTFAFVGFGIILSSYLILALINPQLVKFHLPSLTPAKLEPIEEIGEIQAPSIPLTEIPVGTLITSETGVSSFILTPGTDPPYNHPNYDKYFPGVVKYPTDYQGAINGRRVKRIHEVTQHSVPMSGIMVFLVEKLKGLTDKCVCRNCECIAKQSCRAGECQLGICTSETRARITCAQLQIVFFTGAYTAWLDGNNILERYVKANQGLLVKIENCDPEGTAKIMQAIKKAIEIENKGTWTPKTDPPERDVQQNIWHLEKIIEYLNSVKLTLTPEIPGNPCSYVYSNAQVGGEIAKDVVPMIEEVNVIEDPATFYCSLSPLKILSDLELLQILSQELGSSEAPSTCDDIVEIPVGKAIDEALKLANDMLRELKNIWKQGHQQIEWALQMNDIADKIKTENNCSVYCIHKVRCLFTNPETHRCEVCECTCKESPTLTVLRQKLQDLLEAIKQAHDSIFMSFKRINSKDPLTGQRVPIGIDRCCVKPLGDCFLENEFEKRDYTLKEKLLEVQKLLDRARLFSTYELLLKQLANLKSSGRLSGPEYARLPDPIKEFNKVLSAEYAKYRYDLTNCDVLTKQHIESEETVGQLNILESCYVAKTIYHLNPEYCRSNPPYNCDYFNPISPPKLRQGLLCYCNQPPDFSEIASDFFCCVSASHMLQKER
ncbi:hypothetical protein J7K92_02085 [bacterium]|nr:hypothetical protein [bacterium]